MFETILIKPLYNALLAIYALIPGHDFGLAVILFTVLVRVLLWPLVRKQLHSQRAMQKLSPDIAKIKQQAKGDRQKESQLLLELYKERGISPLASLVPLFVQLPLLFAFFFVIQHAINVGDIGRLGYDWLKNLEYIKTILGDNQLFKATLFGLDLVKPSLVLAVLAGIAQFLQSKQILPKQTGDDPAAKMANTSLYIVPVITIVFGMQLPAALSLYWAVTSLVALVQQEVILRQDVQEMETKQS